jgi:hypothetical protein
MSFSKDCEKLSARHLRPITLIDAICDSLGDVRLERLKNTYVKRLRDVGGIGWDEKRDNVLVKKPEKRLKSLMAA